MTPTRRLLAVVAVVALAGCSGDSSLNTNKLAGQMQRRLRSAGVRLKRIECPKARPLKNADTFDCHATAKNGALITIRAVQSDTRGHVRWEVVSGLIDVATVRDNITKDFADVSGLTVTVACPAGNTIAANDGKTFVCTVANAKNADDPPTSVTITVNSAATNGRGFEWAPTQGQDAAARP